ncbi:hypothetical protein AMAG_12034 [Allomyces macrogynus ATCC 38327]|uniref:t-SNARE coiled-coil homology domain-containing protein n=1 Tax=Allomyces macrogynus (strain ATCC 38327) TaxID=578462 RepID=A0A0L0SYK2_ALLM3|nr:hypothetical protein AMAG_12034 [Allomyces macrogynus ATCC 38327]|eukprot:KNE67582.1 hypothetical protein AMAG_12034 [Allomyces macrogynus ATCC 38327]
MAFPYRPVPTSSGVPPPSAPGAFSNGITSRPGARSSPSTSSTPSSMSAFTMERQNDEHVDRLHEKAAMLKHLTLNLGDEIQESNRFLDQMNTTFTTTDGLLASASRRLRGLRRAGGANLWCYLTLFILAVFFVLYFFVVGGKRKGSA